MGRKAHKRSLKSGKKSTSPRSTNSPVALGRGTTQDSKDSTKNGISGKTKGRSKSRRRDTIRKEVGKRDLLKLVETGRTLPTAIAELCMLRGYKSSSTIYKWLKEDAAFREAVLNAELKILGQLEETELEAAKGGQQTGKEKLIEYFANGRIRKKKTSESFAPPNAVAARNALNRRGMRLRKAQRDSAELDRVSNLIPTFEDAEGHEIPMVGTVVFLIEPAKPKKDGSLTVREEEK